MSYLLEHVALDTSWRAKQFDLMSTRLADELNRMGFTEGWKESSLWKPWVEKHDSSIDIFILSRANFPAYKVSANPMNSSTRLGACEYSFG